MSKPKRKGTATTTTAAPKQTTSKPASAPSKGTGKGKAEPKAPPLGHHVKPTGDRRKRFRKD